MKHWSYEKATGHGVLVYTETWSSRGGIHHMEYIVPEVTLLDKRPPDAYGYRTVTFDYTGNADGNGNKYESFREHGPMVFYGEAFGLLDLTEANSLSVEERKAALRILTEDCATEDSMVVVLPPVRGSRSIRLLSRGETVEPWEKKVPDGTIEVIHNGVATRMKL